MREIRAVTFDLGGVLFLGRSKKEEALLRVARCEGICRVVEREGLSIPLDSVLRAAALKS